jgi:glycosyltransferase involved in cell wall biosynthesis
VSADTLTAPLLPTTLRCRLTALTLRCQPASAPAACNLIVDVSVIVQQDVRTGIQWMVRALLGQHSTAAGRDPVEKPVFASPDHGYCRAVMTSEGRIASARRNSLLQPVVARREDVLLGLDLEASHPSRGFPADIPSLREWLRLHRVLLTVGTIEPCKGQQQLIDAMSWHWQPEPASDVALLVVGRPGWKTTDLQAQLCDHLAQGRRLLLLEGVSDELLAALFAGAAGLDAASQGEDCGLPQIEALAHGTPVPARDLPVFHDIGGSLFDHVDDDAPAPLAARLQSRLHQARHRVAEAVAKLPRWAVSANAFANCIGIPLAQRRKGMLA